ncbi:MAG: hypothetical protein ACE5LU_26705 [Anaerolineae bacterium]
MEKTITLIIPGAGDEAEARDAPIGPGTTAADILRAAGKDPQNWQLQLKRGDGFVSLSGQDDVHKQVENGEKVFAVPKDIVVG